MINVILASSLLIMREGLKHILQGLPDIQVVGESDFAKVEYTTNPYAEYSDAVAIVTYPDGNDEGENTHLSLFRDCPLIKVIVIAQHDSVPQILSALRIGARGLLSAGFGTQMLPAAIRSVAQGHIFLNDEIAAVLAKSSKEIKIPRSDVKLTGREAQIFERIAKGGRVCSIAAELNISKKTVSTHKTRLMEKLGTENISELIQYAIKENIVEVPISGTMTP